MNPKIWIMRTATTRRTTEEPHDYQDMLKNFKYVELTGEEDR